MSDYRSKRLEQRIADDRADRAQRLREWAKRHFGKWITTATARKALKEIEGETA